MKFRASILVVVTLLCSSLFAADDSYVLGRVRNGTYTNQQLGMRAYFSENWRILSREEIAQLNGVDPSAPQTMQSFKDGTLPFFYAMSEDGLAHVLISLANLGVMGNAVSPRESEKALDEAVKQFSDSFVDSFREMRLVGAKIKRSKQSIAGKKYPGFNASAKMKGVDVYMKGALCHRDEYLYGIVAMSFSHDITDKLLGMFRKTGIR
ncbi:MAG: hypothetical protein IJQ58_01655 [Synergistaceae bacterium]|nr:hypothetical protein [Synergistaceae bacterium]